jgi:hypothetical protein
MEFRFAVSIKVSRADEGGDARQCPLAIIALFAICPMPANGHNIFALDPEKRYSVGLEIDD